MDEAKEEFEFEKPAKVPPWFLPPQIRPNYRSIRKRNSMIPRSKVEHVLLHENQNQKNILSSRLSYLKHDYIRISRTNELQKKAFLVRQSAKQATLWENGIDHVRILPTMTVESHLPGARRQSMQSSQRRYLLTLRSASSRSQEAGATPRRKAQPELKRSHTFHVSSGDNSKLDESVAESIQKGSISSGHLPRKPTDASRMKSNSLESFEMTRNKTELTLNLTKSFTTYDKYKREVTINDPKAAKRHVRDDPRFKRLHTALIPPGKPIDAMLQLSPSGRKVAETYGNTLMKSEDLHTILDHFKKTFPKREPPGIKFEDSHDVEQVKYYTPMRRYGLSHSEAFVDDESVYDDASLNDTDSMIFS